MTATTKAHAAIRAYREGYTWGPRAVVAFLEKRGAWKHFTCAVDFEMRRKSKPIRNDRQ